MLTVKPESTTFTNIELTAEDGAVLEKEYREYIQKETIHLNTPTQAYAHCYDQAFRRGMAYQALKALREKEPREQEKVIEVMEVVDDAVTPGLYLCTCTCADPCPLHKTGSSIRCTEKEINVAGIKTRRVKREIPE